MNKQLNWKLKLRIGKLFYRFGVHKSSAGFVMPTVLAFIIIASGIILYQSSSLLNQMYNLKSAIDDLNTIEVAVNTMRIVNELEQDPSCNRFPKLVYQLNEEEEYQISFNCLVVGSNSQLYNAQVQLLLESNQISKSKFEETVIPLFESIVVLEDLQTAMITYQSETFDVKYEYVLYIGIVKYFDNNISVLVIDNNNELLLNLNVKQL